MRLEVLRFEPYDRLVTLTVPVGSRPLLARMTPVGQCEVVFVTNDAYDGTEPVRMRVLFEDEPGAGGPLTDWRWLGSWAYANGRIAHAFVEDDPQPQPQRRQRKAAPVDSGGP